MEARRVPFFCFRRLILTCHVQHVLHGERRCRALQATATATATGRVIRDPRQLSRLGKRLCCLSLLVEVILDLCGQSLDLLRQERNVFLECVDRFEL